MSWICLTKRSDGKAIVINENTITAMADDETDGSPDTTIWVIGDEDGFSVRETFEQVIGIAARDDSTEAFEDWKKRTLAGKQ